MNDTKGGGSETVAHPTDTLGQPNPATSPGKSVDPTDSQVTYQGTSRFDNVKMRVEQGEVEKHEQMKQQVKKHIKQIEQFVGSIQLKNEPEELKNKNTTTQVQENKFSWKDISDNVKERSYKKC
jgi:hypothetical protein